VGDRVRCLAIRFDEGSEDRNGDIFSVRHRREGNGDYCYGTVKWVFSSRGRAEQCYRVLYDGDTTQMRSVESHLEREVIEGVEPASVNEAEGENSDDGVEVDGARSVWHQTPKIRCHDSYWWMAKNGVGPENVRAYEQPFSVFFRVFFTSYIFL
jgi:hypothetical protein